MGVSCARIIDFMNGMAPEKLAEDWDNVGLMLGSKKQQIERVMTCLDVTPEVVNEAIEKNVGMIVSHHPLIFKGIKNINEDSPAGRLIYRLVKAGICVYSAHTNLDVADGGVNDSLAELLELKDTVNLNTYSSESLYKIVVFVPKGSEEPVRDAMSRAGAGWIGNYSDCTFMAGGTGTFKPLEGTNPYIGSTGCLEKVEEYRLETIAGERIVKKVISAMKNAHPYEEVAYDVYRLERKGKEYGLGKAGTLEKPMALPEFVEFVKRRLGTGNIRFIGNMEHIVSRVAVFCGSFDENFSGVLREKADVLVTGDVKYHSALEMRDMGLNVIDAGHFYTERAIAKTLEKKLKEEFKDIDVISSSVEKDPFNFC